MAEVFFGISAAVLVIGFAATVLLQKLPCKKNPVFSAVNCLMATAFLSVLLLVYPIHADEFGAGAINTVKSLLVSIHTTITIFIIDCDYAMFTEYASAQSPVLAELYSTFCIVLYALAPLLTFGFILSFFKNIAAYWKLFWSFRSDLYVFSALNEESLILAADIKAKTPRAKIVFTDVGTQEEDAVSELAEEARELNAICFKKDIVDIHWDRGTASRKVFLFAISGDETKNVEQSIKLQAHYHAKENFQLYVFAAGVESEVLFRSVADGMHIRRVNPISTLVDHFLYEDGAQIFEGALSDGSTERQISIVLLGIGQHGTELLKALPWFCQMDGYRVTIHAFDRDPEALEKFTAQCPELMSSQRNGTIEPGEAQYTINIYPGVDIGTSHFQECIQSIQPITCVFAALGDDSANIEAAIYMRMLCERKGNHPSIHAIVYASSKKEMLQKVTDYRGHSYDIHFFGDLSFTYSSSHITDSALYQEALQRHLKWGKEPDFWAYEFNFRSSIAAAIHLKMREVCKMPWSGKPEEMLTLEERDALELLEHRRWNAYMRSEGYVYSGSVDKAARNDLAKLHNNLIPFQDLPEQTKRLDSAVGSK